MVLKFHPKQGALVLVQFDRTFKEPEMVKARPCIVISKHMKARPDLLTVVPLSTTPPRPAMPWHCEIEIDLELPPKWSSKTCWVKGDMVYAIGFHRADLFRLGKDQAGRRMYQTAAISAAKFTQVQRCVLAAIGLSHLTKHL
jgi:mRNA interferase MazF